MTIFIMEKRDKKLESILSKYMFRLDHLIYFSPMRSIAMSLQEHNLNEACKSCSGLILWSDRLSPSGFQWKVFGKECKRFSDSGLPNYKVKRKAK